MCELDVDSVDRTWSISSVILVIANPRRDCILEMAHERALLVLCISALFVTIQAGDFFSLFEVNYGGQNIHPDDTTNSVDISLTADGVGSTFQTINTYLFGSISAEIQLVAGDSAGTVAAFFMMSNGSAHDEIDFEFLGNASGQPYLLHTNLFANGTGSREEEIYLWFDPTTSPHKYEIVWNHELILWLVDDIPIRVYHNIENIAPLSFPTFRPMFVSGCIYEASTWATEGGAIPINYTFAPFNVKFQNFALNACAAQGSNVGTCATNYESNFWELPPYTTFNENWNAQMSWVRHYYLHYDYCTDASRYTTPPVECQYNGDLSTNYSGPCEDNVSCISAISTPTPNGTTSGSSGPSSAPSPSQAHSAANANSGLVQWYTQNLLVLLAAVFALGQMLH